MGLLHPIPYVLHQATYIVTPFSYAPTISWFVFQNEIKKIVLQNNLCFCWMGKLSGNAVTPLSYTFNVNLKLNWVTYCHFAYFANAFRRYYSVVKTP